MRRVYGLFLFTIFHLNLLDRTGVNATLCAKPSGG